MVHAEFLIPSLLAVQATRMPEEELTQNHLDELMALEEHRFLARHHQEVEKSRYKVWHDRHIRIK